MAERRSSDSSSNDSITQRRTNDMKRLPRVLVVSMPLEGHYSPLFSLMKLLEGSADLFFTSCSDFGIQEKLKERVGPHVTFVGTGPRPAGYDQAIIDNMSDEAAASPKIMLESFGRIFVATEEVMLQSLVQQLDSGGLAMPDMIIADVASLAGHDLAEKYDVPLVVVAPNALFLTLSCVGLDQYNAGRNIPIEHIGVVLPESMTMLQRYVTNPFFKYMVTGPNNLFVKIVKPMRTAARAKVGLPPVDSNTSAVALGSGVTKWMMLQPVPWALEMEGRTVPPNWHLTGPIAFDATQSFPPVTDSQLLAFLSDAEAAGAPVVYVATGTVVAMTPQQVGTLARALAAATAAQGQAPPRFVWSLKAAQQAHMPSDHGLPSERLLVRDWVPQQALLAHPSVKAFVSHVGMNSLIEAATAGVPVLATPFGADQFVNAQHVLNRGMGLALASQKWSAPRLAALLSQLLRDEGFAAAAAKVSAAVREVAGPRLALKVVREFMEGVVADA